MSARKDGVKARPLWRSAAAGAAAAASSTALAFAAAGLARADIAILFLLGVLAAGALSGLVAGLTAAAAGALAYNILFLDPRFSLDIAHAGDVLTFGVFFLAALLTGWLSARAREAAVRARVRSAEVERLLGFARRLAAAASPAEVAEVLVREAAAPLGGAAVLLVEDGGSGTWRPLAACPPGSGAPDEALLAARSAEDGTAVAAAGWTVRSLPGRSGGVLATAGLTGGGALLAAMAEQAAVALDRAALAEQAAELRTLRQTDRLRAALLNSVSHDLRTPLTGILGSATTLLDLGDRLPPAERRDLLEGVQEEAARLARYIGGLLELAQLEAGALTPRRERTDLRELVGEAVRRSAPADGARGAALLPAGGAGPDVLADPALLTQALHNVLDNAFRHGRAETPVRVLLDRDEDHARVLVEDDGPGVPAAAQAQVFSAFSGEGRRGQGAGLGLSIARGFVEALGGELRLESPVADGRGTRFVFRLPLAQGDRP